MVQNLDQSKSFMSKTTRYLATKFAFSILFFYKRRLMGPLP